MLSTSLRLFALCLGFALCATPSVASTRVGIYAIIDEVTFEPSDIEPDRIVISGTFVVPVFSSGEHGRPSRGLLYFSVNPDSRGPTRTDWRALRKAAGMGEVVGFGQYWMPCARITHLTPPRQGWPANANCSLEVTVNTDRTKAIAEPYPAPSEEGVVTAFDHDDDICPRFGRSSVRIAEELRTAHSPGSAWSEPPLCKDWVGLVMSSDLERTFPTQARDAEWAEATEALILRRLTQAQGLALSELGVECRDTICYVRLAYPTKVYQEATGNRLTADALLDLPGFAQGAQLIPSDTDPTMEYYIQRRKVAATETAQSSSR
jgi:hypothetical protein